jgi:hypothetical protein
MERHGAKVTQPIVYYPEDHRAHQTGYIEPMCETFGASSQKIVFPTTKDKLAWMTHVSLVLFEEDRQPTLVVEVGTYFKKRMNQLPPPPEDADLIFFNLDGMSLGDPCFFTEKTGGYCRLDPSQVLVSSYLCYWVRNPRALCDFCCAHPDTLVNSLVRYQQQEETNCYAYWAPINKTCGSKEEARGQWLESEADA